jgi:hypothetical protein
MPEPLGGSMNIVTKEQLGIRETVWEALGLRRRSGVPLPRLDNEDVAGFPGKDCQVLSFVVGLKGLVGWPTVMPAVVIRPPMNLPCGDESSSSVAAPEGMKLVAPALKKECLARVLFLVPTSSTLSLVVLM